MSKKYQITYSKGGTQQTPDIENQINQTKLDEDDIDDSVIIGIGNQVYQNVSNNKVSKIEKCENDERFCLVDKDSPSKLKYNFYKSDEEIKGLIVDSNNYYINKQFKLGLGSFGTVYRLINLDSTKRDSYVLKHFRLVSSYLEERLMSFFVRNLESDKISIVNSYWYNSNNKFYILLNGLDGDLERLARDGFNYNPFKIFLQIVENVYELYKNDMYYFDLKLANCLYKVNNGNIKVYIGDIGSIVSLYKSETFNLFKSDDLLNTKIRLTYQEGQNSSNFCKLEIFLNKFYDVGYVDIGDNTVEEIKAIDKKEFKGLT